MQVTRFPARADGIADRMADFVAHLRMNGIAAGDLGMALGAVQQTDPTEMGSVRAALRCVLVGNQDGWRRFDDLFDAFWFNAGKTRAGTGQSDHVRVQSATPTLWQPHFEAEGAGTQASDEAGADPGEETAEGTDGRLIATRTHNLLKRDLRELMDEASLRDAEAAALRLAKALRDRRSRRQRRAARGRALDLRRIQRASLARGGEPLDLHRKARPPRPLQITALCDVSGSMTLYARVFLAFLRGLTQADTKTDAYLFHTRLLRITDALRDTDGLRAATRLSLMAEGFGGGTNISGALETYLSGHGRRLGRRSIVVILSDGYCSTDPDALAEPLARLRRRARRILWLNPLKGWETYEPVAQAIRAATPYLDAHLPANTIETLAALEPEFARL